MMVSQREGQLRQDGRHRRLRRQEHRRHQGDAKIDTTTITTNNEKRDAHLKSADFFDVPRIRPSPSCRKRAEAAGAGKFRLIGDLTMRGVTKEVVLDVEGPTEPFTAQGRSASVRPRRRP